MVVVVAAMDAMGNVVVLLANLLHSHFCCFLRVIVLALLFFGCSFIMNELRAIIV